MNSVGSNGSRRPPSPSKKRQRLLRNNNVIIYDFNKEDSPKVQEVIILDVILDVKL